MGMRTLLAALGAAVASIAFGVPAYATTSSVPCDGDALKTAITVANSTATDTLSLASGCTYVIRTPAESGNALPTITADLTIVGNGATIMRNATTQFRVLHVSAGVTVKLSHLAISGGNSITGTLGASGDDGGGIRNDGNLRLAHVLVSGNIAGDGTSGGAAAGGGRGGGIYNSGTLTLVDSKVISNAGGNGGSASNPSPAGVGGAGGGIYNLGSLTLKRSKVLANHAGNGGNDSGFLGGSGGSGGGIYNANGHTVKLSDSSVKGNAAGTGGSGTPSGNNGTGGGIYNGDATKIVPIRTAIKSNVPNNCAPPSSVSHCSG